MTLNEKRSVYRNIMLNVSKIVKQKLNEAVAPVSSSNNNLITFLKVKTAPEKLISNALWDILHRAGRKDEKYKIKTKNERSRLMHNWMIWMVNKEPYASRLNGKIIKNVLAKYGITNGEDLGKQIIANLDEFKTLEIDSYGNLSTSISRPSGIDTSKDEKIRERGKQLLERGLVGVPRAEINNITLGPGERLLLVRTKYKMDGVEPLLYVYKGGSITDGPELRNIKYAYAVQESVNYYAVRPILWETVKDYPEWQECTNETEDKNLV